jgi:TetR/AcrR family fatty acid metabolism transcriptional regulator
VRTKTLLQAEKMLDAAAHLFGALRFHEVRMEDIAAEAGVGKGTIYRYFSDKEELYLALLARASGQYLGRLRDAVNRVGGPGQRLEALVAAILAYFDEQPHLLDLIQRAEVARGQGPEFPWYQTRLELNGLILSLLEEGQCRGAWRLRDPDLATMLLLGGLRGVLRFGRQPRPTDLARQIVSSFLHGAVLADCP